MEWGQAGLWLAISLGIGGSLHCMGMCGPLIMSIPFNTESKVKATVQFLLYVFSKAVMYGMIGLVPGMLGWSVQKMIGPRWISVIVGCLVLIVAVIPSLKLSQLLPIAMNQFIRDKYQRIYHRPKWYYFVVGGLFNALLPCGMILIALTTSMVMASPFTSFWFMFYFGVGTIPALAIVQVGKVWYLQRFRFGARRASRFITLILGIVLLIRGLLPAHQHSLFTHPEETITECKSKTL